MENFWQTVADIWQTVAAYWPTHWAGIGQTILAVGAYAQQWQTLLAALVALVAAKRAYAAAMAKVELDREIHLREVKGRQLTALLRVRAEISIVKAASTGIRGVLDDRLIAEARRTGERVTINLGASEMTDFKTMVKFEKVWDSLDVVPISLVEQLKTLEHGVPYLQGLTMNRSYTMQGEEIPKDVERVINLLKDFEKTSVGILDVLDSEIKKITKVDSPTNMRQLT